MSAVAAMERYRLLLPLPPPVVYSNQSSLMSAKVLMAQTLFFILVVSTD